MNKSSGIRRGPKARHRVALPCILALGAGGCVVGPVYHAPVMQAPSAYKNVETEAEKTSPNDNPPPPPAELEFANWWSIFNDPQLSSLESQALKASPLLESAAARVDGARAKLMVAAGDKYPTLASQNSVQLDGASRTYSFAVGPDTVNFRRRGDYYDPSLVASYELDLWGRVKHENESATADLEAAAIDRDGVLLTLTAQVADTYYSLRALDAEIDLLHQTRDLRQDAFNINQTRFHAGLVGGVDISRSEVELASIDSDIAEYNRLRGAAEDAMALLCGQPASNFKIPPTTVAIKATDAKTFKESLLAPPLVPNGIPADLLRRRPDLASAERTLAARTADIGQATAQKYPQFNLVGSIGFQSFILPSLLNYPNQVFSYGFQASAPLFTGGKLTGNQNGAIARARGAYADYQQKLLVAYSEAEDAMNDLKWEAEEEKAQLRTVIASTDASRLSRDQYKHGLVNYLIVTDADRSTLSAELGVTQATAARYKATIRLIKALGGGWQPPPTNSSTPHTRAVSKEN